ncbi:hypothetical protein COO16_04195 [Bacillus pseudomycoides]|nr:hypothetical protein COO16_04195 [Bacillus pseudomycoides]
MNGSLKNNLKEKYFISKDNKKSLFLLGKRFLKVLCIILFIKGIRIFLVKNQNVKMVVSDIFSKVDIENFLKFISIQFIGLGIVIIIISYLIKGSSIINNKLFSYIIFLCFIDFTLVYMFPEIYSSIAKAIFIR